MIMRVRLLAAQPSDSPPRLAATITTTLDLATRDEEYVTASSVEDVCAIVRRWIEKFVTQQ
jgi:hypothetical protein